MSTFPFLKISGVFVKFLAKPIATRMRSEAAKSPWLKDRFVWCGEMAHEVQTRVNVFAAGLKFVSVKPLEEDAALEKATDFIAEFLLIGFGTCIIVSEYFRSEKKNAEKALLAAQKEAEEEKRIQDQFMAVGARVRDLEQLLAELEDALPYNSQGKLNSIRKQRVEAAAGKDVSSSSGTAENRGPVTVNSTSPDQGGGNLAATVGGPGASKEPSVGTAGDASFTSWFFGKFRL